MRALARGEAVLAEWIQEGVLVDVNAVADAWNINSQAVHAARKHHQESSLRILGYREKKDPCKLFVLGDRIRLAPHAERDPRRKCIPLP